MSKPFFQLALSTIENPKMDLRNSTTKHRVFAQQYTKFLSLLSQLMNGGLPPQKKSQLQLRIADDFEVILKTLIVAENSYWYFLLLRINIPQLYSSGGFGKDFEFDDNFAPKLIYDELTSADRGVGKTHFSRMIQAVYENMYWTETALCRIQTLEQSSLRNSKIINAIREYDSNGGKTLQERLIKNLLELKNNCKLLSGGK